jgi:DNA-directed RNA polymerase specialized sigma24 family protein
MLIEDPQMQCALRKLVSALSLDPVMRDDLMQEGLIRLWQVECAHPGQTRSWYLQNCRFCVQHCLAQGRSIDSPKRSSDSNRVPINVPDDESSLAELHIESDPVESASFRDLRSALSRQLNSRERVVLDGLATGFRLRDIAAEFNISYPTALKYRRRIAALVSKLGIPRPSAQAKAGVGHNQQGRRRNPLLWAKAAESTPPHSGGSTSKRRRSNVSQDLQAGQPQDEPLNHDLMLSS